jgi:ribonucleoside-diphosphate reductase alpha chain
MQAQGRPEVVYGVTIRVKSPHGTVFVTLNENEEQAPFEIFLNAGKAGSDLSADGEAIGRLCSLLLRLPSPTSTQERLELIIQHLAGIGGSRNAENENGIRSIPDALACALSQYLNRCKQL